MPDSMLSIMRLQSLCLIGGLLFSVGVAAAQVAGTVLEQSANGDSVTLSIDRGEALCCSEWDWVGIYDHTGTRLSYAHSQDTTNPKFEATLAIPSAGGVFTFKYSSSVDGWQMHDLEIKLNPTGATALVEEQTWDQAGGGSVTLSVIRGAGVCCSDWDWVGIYDHAGTRLSHAHSRDTTNPSFVATLAIPSAGGVFTFKYSSSVDGWQTHDLEIKLNPRGATALVEEQTWDQATGGSVTLSVLRGAGVCCSDWDWVGIYDHTGTRLSYAHSQDFANPSFVVTLAIPRAGGVFTFKYSSSVDGWQMHDLEIKLNPTGATALVEEQTWDQVGGGSVTLSVLRGAGVCCSDWDWVGIYDHMGTRLSYAQSHDTSNPRFRVTLAIPNAGGIFTFKYSTSVDGWQKHDLGLELSFGATATAPVAPMATIIPSYWWPTDACWDSLSSAVATAVLPADSITVVLNPNNGNITYGGIPWHLWRDRAAVMHGAGVKVMAYVNLCSEVVDFSCAGPDRQGDKEFSGANGVKAEIDEYVANLGGNLSGIFFDDAGHTGQHTDAILRATNHAASLNLETIHNPGVLSQDQVLFEAANVTIVREGATPGSADPIQSGLPAAKSAMLLHSVDATHWEDYFELARSRGFKYFYAAESWASCPPYLREQLGAIASTLPGRRLRAATAGAVLV